MNTSMVAAPYPVRLTIEYPDGPRNRVTTAFRAVLAVPIMALVCLVSWGRSSGLLTLPVAVMVLFRRKYPRWWFEWHLHLERFETRACAYALLLQDQYPTADEEESAAGDGGGPAPQPVHLDMDYPDAGRELNRWLPLVKWLLVLPHVVVLAVLLVGAVFATIAAWFAILFTGRHPRVLFDYVVGVMRWCSRVTGYATTLITDRYPPFRLAP